jgi:uncharacterized protein (DUF2147 family)
MKIMSGWRWIAALLLATLAWPALSTGGSAASPVYGIWVTENLGLALFECQDMVCGRIVSINDPNQQRSQCGKVIIWGLVASGPAEWTDGSILDTTDGTTYQLSAELQADGVLRARIYAGIPLLGKTKILKRIDLASLRGRC